MSYDKATINLDGCGYTLVQGENNNVEDSAKSNGSGKSALFEGIFYALFGETIRGSKDVINNKGDGTCKVSLDFLVNNISYKVIRGKDGSKSSLQLFINGEDKSGKGVRDTDKALQEYLPNLTNYLVGSVVVLGQGLPQRFSNNTPSGRKELLEKLSNSDFMIDDLKSKISLRKDELQAKQKDCENLLLSLKTQKDMLDRSLESYKDKLSKMSNVDEMSAELESLGKEYDELDVAKSEMVYSLQVLQAQLDNEKEKQAEVERERSKKDRELSNKYQETIPALIQECTMYETKCSALNEQIKKYKSIVDVCPTCGQKIVGVKHIDTEDIERELFENTEKYERCSLRLNAVRTSLVNEQTTLSREFLDRVEACTDAQSMLSKQIEEHSKNLDETKKKLKEIGDRGIELKTKIDIWGSRTSELKQSIESTKDEMEKISEQILYNNNDLNNISNRLSVVLKFSTLINRDFRGVLLENIISSVNHFASQYSNQLFGMDKIKLDLDGNNLNILFGDKEYESLSTGERLKADIVVQLSLRDMLCETLGFSCNIIVLDELFDGLDEIGCEQVINLLFNNLSDISSTFIITHRRDLPITSDNIITVLKNKDGVSILK